MAQAFETFLVSSSASYSQSRKLKIHDFYFYIPNFAIYPHPHFCYLKTNLYAVFLTENIPTKNAWVSVKKICYLEDAPLETQRLSWALWFMQVGCTSHFHCCLLCVSLQVNIFHLFKLQFIKAERKFCLDKLNP